MSEAARLLRGKGSRVDTARFGSIFPNLIAVTTPADFAYLRIDPVAVERRVAHFEQLVMQELVHYQEKRERSSATS